MVSAISGPGAVLQPAPVPRIGSSSQDAAARPPAPVSPLQSRATPEPGVSYQANPYAAPSPTYTTAPASSPQVTKAAPDAPPVPSLQPPDYALNAQGPGPITPPPPQAVSPDKTTQPLVTAPVNDGPAAASTLQTDFASQYVTVENRKLDRLA